MQVLIRFDSKSIVTLCQIDIDPYWTLTPESLNRLSFFFDNIAVSMTVLRNCPSAHAVLYQAER